MIRSGATPSLTSQATREHSVVVLPVPAPARISSGPPGWVAAARCSGLSWSSHGIVPIAVAGAAVGANTCSATLGVASDGLQAPCRRRGVSLWAHASEAPRSPDPERRGGRRMRQQDDAAAHDLVLVE